MEEIGHESTGSQRRPAKPCPITLLSHVPLGMEMRMRPRHISLRPQISSGDFHNELDAFRRDSGVNGIEFLRKLLRPSGSQEEESIAATHIGCELLDWIIEIAKDGLDAELLVKVIHLFLTATQDAGRRVSGL